MAYRRILMRKTMTKINKFILPILTTVIVCFCYIPSAHAWLYYSKPAFCGKVIDAETKQPIEGTVVVVLYNKWEFGGPGGGNTITMDAKETMTDKNGEFLFPSYQTIIGPLSRQDRADFIIFKPGYKSINFVEGKKISDEKYFAIAKDMIGKEGEIKYLDDWDTLRVFKGPLGIVELKRGERDPSIPTDYRSDKLPLLFKALNIDRRNRGYEGEIK